MEGSEGRASRQTAQCVQGTRWERTRSGVWLCGVGRHQRGNRWPQKGLGILTEIRLWKGFETGSVPHMSFFAVLTSWAPSRGRKALYLLSPKPHWHLCLFCPGRAATLFLPLDSPVLDPHSRLWNLHGENLALTSLSPSASFIAQVSEL